MMENPIKEKSFDLAVRIVNLSKHLQTEKHEFVLSNQILRSGTSIGANVSEGARGQSPADFYSKMSIALKEANETLYRIRLLHATDYLTHTEFQSLYNDGEELIRILVAICKSTQNKLKP